MTEQEFVEACLGTLLEWLPGYWTGVRITPEREDTFRVERLSALGYPIKDSAEVFRVTVRAEVQ
jgi:hypothetical protein